MRAPATPILVLLLWGCPAPEPKAADGTPPDRGVQLSEAGLALCSMPAAYCTPADPCGLNPVCSAERLCLTSGARDCDDGVPCTEDRCVPGGCEHTVTDGYCLVEEVCHKKGATAGCGRCQPELSKTRWSPLDGDPCDDGNPCTKGDECKQGLCVGQSYTCADSLACTTDACDGQGGCKNLLDPTYCLIEKACYRNGETDATGCKVCDVAVSQTDWQGRANVCAIDGKCHTAGAKDPTGCFTCEPLHTPTAWTPLPDLCLISGTCVPKGSLHPSGCAACAPSTSSSGWTGLKGAAVLAESFDQGLGGYTTSKLNGKVGWQLSSARYTTPPASLYYGDPAALSYDSGSSNSGSATPPLLDLPAGQKAYLSFQLYLDTETTSSYDLLQVRVAGKVLWNKATDMKLGDYKKWTLVTLDLSPYAGQSIQVQFHFDTKDELNNQSEGIYIDDVTLLTSCGSL